MLHRFFHSFGPAGPGFIAAACVATALLIMATLILWNKVRGNRPARVSQHVGMILICQVAAVAAVFAIVNNANAFFVSWPEVFGKSAGAADVTIAGSNGGSPWTPQPLPAHPSQSDQPPGGPAAQAPTGWTRFPSGVMTIKLTGKASKVHGDIAVWPPSGYSTTHPGGYPVIVVINGFPGHPVDAVQSLNMPARLGAASSARVADSFIVTATTNVNGRNWGCADAPGGPQVETWLTQDVPAIVTSAFAVSPHDRWAVIGLSEGGWCAVRLTLRHPKMFAAAISLSGGNSADAANLTRTPALRKANNLVTMAAAGAHPPVRLLLAASRQDGSTFTDATTLAKSVGPGITANLELLDDGGHNWNTWRLMVPKALDWLAVRWPTQ